MPRFLRWSHYVLLLRRRQPSLAADRRADSLIGARCALLAVAMAVCGCSAKKIEGRKDVFPARGKLWVDGQVAKGALLVLHPTDPTGQVEHPFAHVESDGSFALSTYQGRDGAPAGDYIATIEWRVPRHPGEEGPWPNALPERYAKPATSDLRVHIAQGSNELPPIILQR